MLYTCAASFDMTRILKNFAKLSKSKQGLDCNRAIERNGRPWSYAVQPKDRQQNAEVLYGEIDHLEKGGSTSRRLARHRQIE
jgi:hypothetical protein